MNKIIISLLALGCFATIKPNSSSISSNVSTKSLKLIADSEDSEEYEEDDYEYDGFLDKVFMDSSMETDDENVRFSGCTSADYNEFSFFLNFNIDNLNYETDFDNLSIDISCDHATIDGYGRLESEIFVMNPESGPEQYKISDYRDIKTLEEFVLNPEEEEVNAVSTYRFFSIIKRAIAAIVAAYVIVAENAEQIKARRNHYDNQSLESAAKGVNKGNYITDQREESRTGYNSGCYKFGFTYFGGVGCEVASVYNLMTNEGITQNLSEVIYDFERWAIEFAVGWGNFWSNPRDIYRYLRNFNIKYSKSTSYSAFKRKVDSANNGTRFIMSTWNTNWTNGLHTYFFIKRNDDLETYNFDYNDSYLVYDDIDELYANTGSFIVGYRIYD